MRLPANTYYNESGALINTRRQRTSLENRVKTLEDKVNLLLNKLNDVQSKYSELLDQQATEPTQPGEAPNL